MEPMLPDLLLLWLVFTAVFQKGDKSFLQLSNGCKKRKPLEYNVQNKKERHSTRAGISEEGRLKAESWEGQDAEYPSQGTEDGVKVGDRIAPFVATKESQKFVAINVTREEALP